MKGLFPSFAQRSSKIVGSPGAFLSGVIITVVWALTGPVFRYSDTWQLGDQYRHNDKSRLMVFLIQSTQNRDSKAIHLKLDELIRAVDSARNRLMNLEHCTDDELATIEGEFKRLRVRAPRTKSLPKEEIA